MALWHPLWLNVASPSIGRVNQRTSGSNCDKPIGNRNLSHTVKMSYYDIDDIMTDAEVQLAVSPFPLASY